MRTITVILSLGLILVAAGCCTCPKANPCCKSGGQEACPAARESAKPAERAVMAAKFTAMPVKIDGNLDDPVWKDAKVYPLHLGADAEVGGVTLQEPGEACLAWDDKFLYVGVKYTDSDIIAEGDKDQLHHYLMGDLAEVFLKPASNTWYWELYVTPRGNKTHLWFAGRGRMGLKSAEDNSMEMHVAAQNQGTLNDWRDKDTSWTGEMAIPIAELTRYGDTFRSGSEWLILVSRYNYSRFLNTRGAELSMTPKLPVTSYHYNEGYARLILEK